MPRGIESTTLAIGRELFSAVRSRRPLPMSRAWLDDRAMALAMEDDRLKTQAFRFIDALPGLRDATAINRHLLEYLTPVAGLLPTVLRKGLSLLRGGGPLQALAAAGVRTAAAGLAHKFIAGTTVPTVLATIARLRRESLAFTVDLLGEAVVSEDEADAYQRTCLELISGLADEATTWPKVSLIDADDSGPLPRVNVSVKLSALVSRFEPSDPLGTSRAVRLRLRPILRLARQRGAFINIDMEQSAYKDATLRIVREVLDEGEFRSWSDVGVAIQAYLRSSDDDLRSLAEWASRRGAPLWVRLVKGAYHDHERVIAAQNGWPVPVFTDKTATDANYESLTALLLTRREALRPAFASHNIRSIAHALALADAMRVPLPAFEFQMLFGMADQLKSALVERGARVRVYTPFGRLLPGMAYLVRRLLENTSNQSFVRAGFIEHRDQGGLLMKPTAAAIEVPPASVSTGVFVNHPPADFSRAEPRAAIDAALAALDASTSDCPLLIGGERVRTAATIESLNPSHRRRVMGRCACAGRVEAERAVAVAHAASAAWRETPVANRAALLDRVADVLVRRRFDLAAVMVLEAGKSRVEADADVVEAIDFCRFYACDMRRLSTPRQRDVPGEENRYFYAARGVTVVIAPWNFPLAILCGMTAAAVVAGNTVIMKPAEQTPVIAWRLMEAFIEAGAPPGVVNYLPGVGEEIGPLLVGHPEVSLIAFTGSQAVGLAINRLASAVPAGASDIKRVICEMGGKNAIIVDDDADLDEAVLGVMHSAFGYQGQKCSACARVIVAAPLYDSFLARLVAATRSLVIGPADDPSATIGPVIDAEASARIRASIVEANRTSRLVYAGDASALADEGFYVAPHIFADVPPDSRLAQEEIFGPVLAVLKATDLDHALRLANATRYALTGGCYSRSPATIERVKREFLVGNLYINRRITGALVDRQPFGGFRMSGIGSKAGGPDYLLQFLVPRCITENTMRHGFTPDAS